MGAVRITPDSRYSLTKEFYQFFGKVIFGLSVCIIFFIIDSIIVEELNVC